jgi:superfamily II DNA or RNA helicase
MLARIVDNKFVYLEQISVNEEKIIDDTFSVEHPRARYIDMSMGFFDGVIRKYNRFHHRLARPLLPDLIDVCNKFGLPLAIVDDRPKSQYPQPDPSNIAPDMLHGITLESYQLDAIKAACNNELGIISAPTGAGKSEIMAGIAKALDRPTVVLCDMTVVVDQLKDRLELRRAAEEIGMFYAGRRPNGQQIIVGSFQSLIIPSVPKKTKKDTPTSYATKLKAYRTRRTNARKLRDVIGKCDLLLIDECDIASSKQWRNLFYYWFKGRRKYGFSGTPFDPSKPVQNLTLKENLGPIIYHIDRKQVQATNRIIPVTYTALAFGDESQIKSKTAYDIALKEQMIENDKFHLLIKRLVDKLIADDPTHGILILVESIPLGNALSSVIDKSMFICGNNKMSDRKEAIASFERRDIQILIGGKIVKRGLDLKGGCESLIIATGGKLSSDFNQKIGRAVRRNERGHANIYDFFFIGNHYLYAHSRRRIKAIVDMGYPAKVVFKHGIVEASKFIKSRFRRPKPK